MLLPFPGMYLCRLIYFIKVTYCNGMNSEAHMRIQLFFKPGIEDTCKTVKHHQNASCFFFLAEIDKPVLKFI